MLIINLAAPITRQLIFASVFQILTLMLFIMTSNLHCYLCILIFLTWHFSMDGDQNQFDFSSNSLIRHQCKTKMREKKRLNSKVFHFSTKAKSSKASRLCLRLSAGDNETPTACHPFAELHADSEEWSDLHPGQQYHLCFYGTPFKCICFF